MPRMLDRANEVLGDAWWGTAPRKVREGGWTPSTATRGSDPEDYRSMGQAEAAGRAAGEQAAASGSPSAGASNSAPSKPPPPQDDNSYAGQGNYTYRVDPATGDIFILQSGYGGKVTDYSAAPKKVARGSSAYNAIVAELNQMHNLGLRPVQATRPAGQGQGAKPPPPPPTPPPKNEAPPRTGPAPAGDAWFNMEADASTRPSAASAVDAWFNMEAEEPVAPRATAPRGPVAYAGTPPGAGGPGLPSMLDRMAMDAGAAARPGAPAPVYNQRKSAASAVDDFLAAPLFVP